MTLTVKTNVSGSLSSTNNVDNYVDRTLKTKIEKLMHRWPSTKIDGAPCNITGLALSHSTSPPLPVNLPDHEPYDYELHLDQIATKVDQMCQCWLSTSTVMPTEVIDPHPTMTKAEDDSDPSMLAAVQSLDNFLLKYPHPNDSDAPYQPSPNCLQLPSCHDHLTQQTQVLCTVNVLLGEINNKLSRFIDALSGSKPYTIEMSPKFLPRTLCNPAPAAPRLPTKTVRTPQHSIPAKPPFPQFHHNLTLHWTKANLHPP